MAEFDPARFFMMGQQSKAQEEAFKLQQDERQRMQAITSARASYFQGQGQELQRLAPSEWSALELSRAQRMGVESKGKIEQAEAARQQQLFRSRAVLGGLTRASEDPAQWPAIVRSLESSGVVEPGQFDPSQIPPMDLLASAINEQRANVAALVEPDMTPDMKEIIAASGYGPGQEAFALQDPKVQKSIADMRSAKLSESKSKDVATELRKEFQSQPGHKQMQEIDAAAKKVFVTTPTGAGDMALVFAYMKLLDPGSGVKEGEYATAANAGSVPQTVLGMYNRALNGQKLAPELRTQFRNESRLLLQVHRNQYAPMVKEYRRLASQAGVNPNDVVLHTGWLGPIGEPEEVSAPEKGQPSKLAGQVITDGQQRAFLPEGTPMPAGWRAQ